MPLDVDDVTGWPTATAVTDKATSVVDISELTTAAQNDIPIALAAVIAEFQCPLPLGTGRNFTPITETRFFDGLGYPELQVPDIIPGSITAVSIFNVPISNYVLKTDYHGLGYNVIVRNADGGYFFNAAYTMPGIFVVGHQNVSVTASWGVLVSTDIADAIACEAARRILTQGVAGINGAGEMIKDETTEIASGTGMLGVKTSVLLDWASRYSAVKCAYSDKEHWKRKALFRRMS